MTNKKLPDPVFGFGCWAFMYGCNDRFGSDYNPHPLALEEVFDLAADTEGIDYVCGHYPGEFPDDVARLTELATTRKIGIANVVAKTFGSKFKNGGITNPDPKLRAEALGVVTRCMEMNNALLPVMKKLGKTLGCTYSVNWLGHDGSNGLFTTDYGQRWKWLIEGYAEAFRRVPSCKIALEPKPGDPAEDIFVRMIVHGLYLSRRVDELLPQEQRGRLGLNPEYGHEHLAECVNTVRYRRALIELMPGPQEMQALYSDPDETRVSKLIRDVRNRKVSFVEARYRGARNQVATGKSAT